MIRQSFLWPRRPDPSTWSPRQPRQQHRPDYRVTLGLDVVAGRLECVEVTVVPVRPGLVVTGTLLRSLPVGRLVAETIDALDRQRLALERGAGPLPDNAADMDEEWLRRRAAFWERARADAERLAPIVSKKGYASRGRRYPPDHLQRVAAVYSEAAKERPDPTAAVADLFHVTRSAAAKWVSRAREKSLLPPATTRRPQP